MAGILFSSESTELVTLTTKPNTKCAQYHRRMPVLIQPDNIDYWFNANSDQLLPIFDAVSSELINISSNA